MPTNAVKTAWRRMKKSKKGSSKCDRLEVVIEPSINDVEVGNTYVWEGNPLCMGDEYTGMDSCMSIGTTYGVCTMFPSEECDSVDSWEIMGSDGECIGTLISCGITTFTEATVIGGTGCFENAKGTIESTYGEVELEDGTEVETWTYKLSNVQY
jgi:hypothetical protein